MDYATIKLLHQSAVALSAMGFVARGMVALRPRFGWKMRTTAWVLALVVLTWIASVAVLKNPLGFVVLLQNHGRTLLIECQIAGHITALDGFHHGLQGRIHSLRIGRVVGAA